MSSSVEERPPRLVLRFAVAAALALVLAALVILWFVRRQANERALSNVSSQTQFIADTILRNEIRMSDLRRPVRGDRLRDLDLIFGEQVFRGGGLRANLYGRSGVVTFSTDFDLIGRRQHDEGVAEALAGRVSRDVSRLNDEGGSGDDAKVVEAYVPIRFREGGKPVGALELYQDYAPVARRCARQWRPWPSSWRSRCSRSTRPSSPCSGG